MLILSYKIHVESSLLERTSQMILLLKAVVEVKHPLALKYTERKKERYITKMSIQEVTITIFPVDIYGYENWTIKKVE